MTTRDTFAGAMRRVVCVRPGLLIGGLVLASLALSSPVSSVGPEFPASEEGVAWIKMVQPPPTSWLVPVFVTEGLTSCGWGQDYSFPPQLWVTCRAATGVGGCEQVAVDVSAPPVGAVAVRSACGGDMAVLCEPWILEPDDEGLPFECHEETAGLGGRHGSCRMYAGIALAEPVVATCSFRFATE